MFQGQAIHPAVTRIAEATWQPSRDSTIGFRNGNGVWTDLTPFVTWEEGQDSLTLTDLPRSLLSPRDTVIGGRLDVVKSVAPDPSVPSAPTDLSLTSQSYLSDSGAAKSSITATWTAPMTNTDGSVLTDFAHYLVEHRWTSRQFGGAQVTQATTVDIVDLVGNLPYEVRVAAVDRLGNTSPWVVAGLTS